MRESSWRGGRRGMRNALFVASSLEQLPAELSGMAALVTVHVPWGTRLDAAIGRDRAGTDQLAALVSPRGTLRVLVSSSDRDRASGATDLDPEAIVGAYRACGFEPVTCREASLADVDAARSSWGRRLLSGPGDRRAWLIELRRVESGGGGAVHRVRT